MNYEHDLSFASLKRTTETIKGNYSTPQYLKTLDHFVYRAIGAMVAGCPELVENYVSKVVAQQAVRNSKMTSDDKELLPARFVNLLLADSPSQKLQCIRDMHINRGIMLSLVSLFLTLTKDYKERMSTAPPDDIIEKSEWLRQNELMARQLEVSPDYNLYGLILQVEHWHNEATSFRNVIIEKYMRMTINAAQRTYKDFAYQKKLSDVIGIYLMTLNKAIDRCDSRHGVLTTFITQWFKGARSQVADEIRYDQVSDSYDQRIEDEGDSLSEDIGHDDLNSGLEAVQALAYIARKTDPRGCVRASLGIPEFLPRKFQQILEALIERG